MADVNVYTHKMYLKRWLSKNRSKRFVDYKMWRIFFYWFVLLFLSGNVIELNAASPLQKCKKDDTMCLKDLVQAIIAIISDGDQELGLDPLDPLNIGEIDSSSSTLQLNLKDITVTGLKGCIAKKVKYNSDKSSLFMKLMCSVNVDGQYNMTGKLLFLSIEGHGKIQAVLRKAIFGVDSELSVVVGGDEEKHLNIVDWSHSYDLKDEADLHFDNLFNGNEVLGKAAQDVIENNSNDIIIEVGSPIVKTIISEVVKSVQKLYHALPLQDLIIDYN